jgi:hypothetical protein
MDRVGRGWNRVFSVVVIALVLGTVALLVAGYGVAVGLGALAGLIIGSVAGSLGLLWLARGPGRSITFGTMDWSSDRPSVELMSEMHDLAEVGSIDIGRARSVRPVLERTTVGGLEVEFVAVEWHEGGLLLTFEVRSAPGIPLPTGMVRMAVSDDAGTAYRAGGNGQGGWPGRMRYEATAVPLPPAAATRLAVAIERFLDPFPGGRATATGPWEFAVDLPDRDRPPAPD